MTPRLTGPRRLLLLLLLLVLALAAAVTVFTATVPLLRDWFDLRVYHGALHNWLREGGRLYDYRVPGTPYGFTYPPFAALAMLPLAWLPFGAAVVIALLLDLAALAVVLRLLTGRAWRRHGWYGCALAACVLALFEPLRDTVSFGQVNLLLLALVLVDGWLLATGRDRWAGVGIGLAAAIKLTPALFAGLLLLAGRRRAAGVATAVAAGATALAAAAAPDASRFYWTQALWDTSRVGRLDYVSNQSLQGILARLGETDRAVWAAAVVVVLAVWGVRARRAALEGGLAGRVRPDRTGGLSGQPGHLGAPPRLAAPGVRRAGRGRPGPGRGRPVRGAVHQRGVALDRRRVRRRRLPRRQRLRLDRARPAAVAAGRSAACRRAAVQQPDHPRRQGRAEDGGARDRRPGRSPAAGPGGSDRRRHRRGPGPRAGQGPWLQRVQRADRFDVPGRLEPPVEQ
ncbi:hypothetical protein RKD23_006783 [Streptomyces sp. SAI-170]